MSTETETTEAMSYAQEELSENALRIRLAVEPIHERIEMFLSGLEYRFDPRTNRTIKVEIGEPKAKPEGVRALMNVITAYINPQVVQGNLKEKDIYNLMMDFRKSMGSLLAWRCDYYGIKRSERKQIIDFLEPLVFMFISRTKDNKERDSYGMRVIEKGQNTITNQRRGVFK